MPKLLLVFENDGSDDFPPHMVDKLLKGAIYSAIHFSDYDDLRRQMHELSATVIMPIGGKALHYCTGLKNIMDWRGYIIDPADCGPCKIKVPKIKRDGTLAKTKQTTEMPSVLPAGCRHVIPTIDPATVRKSALALMPVLGSDLDRGWRFAQNPELPISADKDFKYYSQPCSHWASVAALDVETNSKGEVTDLAIASPEMTSSVKWNPQTDHWFTTGKTTTVAHNAAFDYEALAKMGIDVTTTSWWCTMLAAFMLNPGGKKSLNWVISQYLDARRHKHLAGKDFAHYNALDARQTMDLYPKLRAGLQRTGQLAFFEEGMMKALPSLVGMHQRGIAVDKDWVAEWEGELHASLEAIISKAEYPNLLTKPLQLANHLGTKNSDEKTLLKLKIKGHPATELIDTVLKYRELAKQHKTYCLPLCGKDRVYPNYIPGDRDTDEGNRGIAYSGRPTARHPNIQNQPKVARRAFIADPGHVLVSLDWSQIEPRIAAAMSRDDVMANDIEAGIYDAVAHAVGCERQVAKTLVLLSAYLGSPKVLQEQLMLNGITKSYKECKGIQDLMFARYKRWHTWRQEIVEKARVERCLTNPFGKWAPFYSPHPAKAVNFNPQSGAACILWYCLPQIEAAIKPHGGTLYCTVHDEVTIQVPRAVWPLAADAAKSVMEQEWPQIGPGFRVPVKVKMGTNWKEQEER